ncbi:MAG: prephenate dehydrogenase [Planctomycetota bacterium]
MKDLRQVSVIGLGLLGGSASLAVLHCFPGVRTVGYSHRGVTRRKARELGVASEVVDDVTAAVSAADIVILATPIFTFEEIFSAIGDSLPSGCIVTDVGSTKVLPHRWAAKNLPPRVFYAGSHPIAGSEQRGVEFARDDLFEGAMCIVTRTKRTNKQAAQVLKRFWSELGCCVKLMSPAEHDRILGNVSHLPHMAAAALVNASDAKELKLAGKGFMDTSRIASGPANIWADVLLANAKNAGRGVDKIIAELSKIKKAVEDGDKEQIQKLLEKARTKRAALIKQKIRSKEIIS